MTTFQRARSEEQRAERRRAILDTAAAMLAEMPVAQVSLNELSRRVGLAKSNVLRYFESREAVLLELLDAALQEWLEQLDGALTAAVDPDAAPSERGDQVAAALATLAGGPPGAVRPDQRAGRGAGTQRVPAGRRASTSTPPSRTRACWPGWCARTCGSSASTTRCGSSAPRSWSTGAVWTHAQPSAAMLAAYEADPSLASMRLDFTATLRETLQVLLTGLLARPSR